MSRCICKVVATSEVRGYLALFPGIVPIGSERFRNGNRIELKYPNGTSLSTSIGSLELACPNPKQEIVILLEGLLKADVPEGTEAWSVDTNAS